MPDTDPAEATAVVSTEDEAAPPEAEPTAEATNEETPAEDSCPRGPTRRSYAPRAPATGNVPVQATTTRSGCKRAGAGHRPAGRSHRPRRNEDHLDDPDALATADDDLLARKPHLASRRPTGENRAGSLTSGRE
jgi:hypothetical protein